MVGGVSLVVQGLQGPAVVLWVPWGPWLFYGGVAQLGEHLICIQKVVGSIPVASSPADGICLRPRCVVLPELRKIVALISSKKTCGGGGHSPLLALPPPVNEIQLSAHYISPHGPLHWDPFGEDCFDRSINIRHSYLVDENDDLPQHKCSQKCHNGPPQN